MSTENQTPKNGSFQSESLESVEQLAADYALIRSGDPGWHIAFKRFRRALGVGHKTIARRRGIHPKGVN